MRDDIHRFIPQWIAREITTRYCKQCGTHVSKTDIIAIGIRKTSQEKNSIFVEYKCSGCENREVVSFYKVHGSVEDLCYLLLDCIRSKRDINKAREVEQKNSPLTKISDDEVKAILEFMNSSDSHEEFMKYIRADGYSGD